MVGTATSNQNEPTDIKPSTLGQESALSPEDQAVLISKYRDAMKSGDKNFAESSLSPNKLATINDLNVVSELYVIAKAGSDIPVAAICFTCIFDKLFTEDDPPDSLSNETSIIITQMREEIRLLLNELKNQHLKLRSVSSTSGGSHTRQSPLLSPRLRMPSEYRCMSRDSMMVRLDNHLNSSSKSFFYQQLFDNLKDDVQRRILYRSIDNTDNPFERCRLIMLSINLFHESVTELGPKLFKILNDQSQSGGEKSPSTANKLLSSSRPPSKCQYAKSMLALDAIPLIFSLTESKCIDVDLDELFQSTINYYSEFYLDNIAQEYEFEELHDRLKKAIAARILGKDIDGSAQEDIIEESLNVSLNLLFEKFLYGFSNDTVTVNQLKKLRALVSDKNSDNSVNFGHIKEVITSLDPVNDIPENILFSGLKGDSSSSQTSTATPPPKGRGRPKKVQPSVIVSPDDGIKRHHQNKAKEAIFIYNSVMQFMFNNCSKYLKQTRSRILMRFDNPLATHIESELCKVPTQRTSRGKSSANDASKISPSKKIKVESQSVDDSVIENSSNEENFIKPSPLNSGQCLKLDKETMRILDDIHQCLIFLTSTSTTTNRLFMRFLNSNNADSLKWYLKIHSDCMLSSNCIDLALNSLDKIMKINQDGVKVKEEIQDSSEDVSTVTVAMDPSASVEVIHLRALVQTISCHVQLLSMNATLANINMLLERIKRSGLLTNDENYETGNIIEEYRILVSNDMGRKDGFLFFDGLSLVRYVVFVLMDILKRYVIHSTPNSDALIGHAIVLSQVDWPVGFRLYEKCINWIRTNKPKSTTPQCVSALTKFTYTDFFNYILDPNIIEDFMALLNEGYTLDIRSVFGPATGSSGGSQSQNTAGSAGSRSSSSLTRSGKAVTTRGVNKTFKEDLKIALVAQMKSSTCLIPLDLMAEFIQTSLVPTLLSSAK